MERQSVWAFDAIVREVAAAVMIQVAPPRGRVGIVGAGNISERYILSLANCAVLDVVGIASARGTTATALAARHGLQVMNVDELLSSPGIDLVLNLAPPLAHDDLNARALAAGKNVYTEKPLATTLAGGVALVEVAHASGLMLASAPAVFLGPALQTARLMIDEGRLGPIVGASATMIYAGPDRWHHNPDHLFARAGGPLFDMGVYHVSALVALLGPIAEVRAVSSRRRQERVIATGPRAGETIRVDVPTHLLAHLRFASGALGSASFSFDGFATTAPGLEIYGEAGALALAQPNVFDGTLSCAVHPLRWETIPSRMTGWREDMWAIGVADAWTSHQTGNTPRMGGAFALHVLEVLTTIDAATRADHGIALDTMTSRPSTLDACYDRTWWNDAAEVGAS